MVPLFGPIPGVVELVVVLLVLVVGLLLTVGVAYWVYRDATKRGNDNAEIWAIAVALGGLFGNLFGLVVLVALYLLVGR